MCPFPECKKAFKTKGHLQEHVQKTRIHIKEEGDNPLS